MPANTSPVFSLTPNNGKVAVTAALTKSDGAGTVGTDIFKLFTAGTNGSYVGDVRFSIAGSVAAAASQATVARVYLATSGSGALVAGTSVFLLAEVALPTQTTDSTTSPTFPAVVPLNRALAPGEFLMVSTHHAPAANTAVHATCNGGDF
jgi:hypothetical protein